MQVIYDGRTGQQIEVVGEPEAAVLVLSKRDVRRLLTEAEEARIQKVMDRIDDDSVVLANCTNITADNLEVYREHLRRAFGTWRDVPEIHSNDPDAIGFFNLMEAVGLLAAGRGGQILAGVEVRV